MLERQSTRVPKTSKTSARTRAQANRRRWCGTVPDAALALARVLVPARVPSPASSSAICSAAWRSGAPFGEVVRADLGVDLGVSPQCRLVVADDVRLGQPAFAAVAQCVLLVVAVTRHLALTERAGRQA